MDDAYRACPDFYDLVNIKRVVTSPTTKHIATVARKTGFLKAKTLEQTSALGWIPSALTMGSISKDHYEIISVATVYTNAYSLVHGDFFFF